MKTQSSTLARRHLLGLAALMSVTLLASACQVGAPVSANGSGLGDGTIVIPSGAPTAMPTAAPTANPTTNPTANPTATPTANPTASPTVAPSASPSAGASSDNLLATLSSKSQFSTLVSLLNRADMADVRAMLESSADGYTIFAPSDQAFANLDADFRTALLNDSARLKQVLKYHVVSGLLPTTELVKIEHTETLLNNNAIVVSVDGDGHTRLGNASMATAATLAGAVDLEASNGLIQEIDRVLTVPNPSEQVQPTPTPVPSPTPTV